MVRYDRLKDAFEESGKTKAYVFRLIDRPRTYFNDCRKTNKDINDKELSVIAAELGVSMEYLRGETDEKNLPAEEVERQKNIDDIYSIIDDMDPTKLLELSQYALNRAREKMK